VVENNTADLSSSALTARSDITNNTTTSQTGPVTAAITPPGNRAPITVSQTVTVPAGKTQTVTFDPSNYPGLTITSPQVWWPYQLGAQPLYTLSTSVSQNNAVLNSTSETFGIRNVTSSLVGSSTGEP
jgi:exo-1,4-beta-D-glucosaminidase